MRDTPGVNDVRRGIAIDGARIRTTAEQADKQDDGAMEREMTS
jgi:hypothetical protein